jgi:photosystem II stability/assembly factor-like uncharacterized protein
MINKAGTFIGTSLGLALLAVTLAGCAATAGAPSATPGQSLPVSPTPATLTKDAWCGNAESRIGQGGIEPVKMLSPTVGWGTSGMRTVDGGAHWYDASPPALRQDAPSDFARKDANPPGYAEFDLDGNRAWEARFYSSSTRCDDRIVTFGTEDGGRSWYQSAPVKLATETGRISSPLRLFFSDPVHGWFLVDSGSASVKGLAGPQTRTLLYKTTDGGRHWKLAADLLKAAPVQEAAAKSGVFPGHECGWFGDVSFASPSTGWISIQCGGSAQPQLFVTHDGGVGWSLLQLQIRSVRWVCECGTNAPTFFDQSRGIIQVNDMSGQTKLLGTSDGGRTWQALSPPGGCASLIDFADANNFWDIVIPEGGCNKACLYPDTLALCPGGPPHGWLYRSSDGGGSWTLVQRNLPIGVTQADTLLFIDGDRAIATYAPLEANGLREEVLTTSDGGHTWGSIEVQGLLPCCFGRF